jgi:hypothetical protein
MKIILALGPAILGLMGLAGTAAAQVPAAVVEDVKGKPPVEFMDYVTTGQVIKLGAKDTIVLGYMNSCWRETITGGTVVVGAEQSMVHQGEITRAKVDCDAGRAEVTSRQARESAATVFRSLQPAQRAETPPQVTLYGLSPIVEIKDGGKLVVERLDRRGERHEVAVRGKSLQRGKFYDFAKAQKALSPGGVYAATAGDRMIVFKIAPDAKPGSTPIVGRLLRLE